MAVTELGCGAATDLHKFFSMDGSPRGGVLEHYKAVWSARVCTRNGGAVPIQQTRIGGGVLLLVRTDLNVDVRKVHYEVPDSHRKWIHGHIGVWQLIPRRSPSCVTISKGSSAHALGRPVIVTVAYVPPQASADTWGKKVRPYLLNALHASEQAIRKLRRVQDIFHIALTHLNSQDGGCEVPLELDEGTLRHEEIRKFLAESSRVTSAQQPAGGALAFTVEDSLCLQRRVCTRAKKVTKDGRELVNMFARHGMVPLNGVFSERQPTTWQPCAECNAKDVRCTHARKVAMRNVNDSVWIPADTVVDAFIKGPAQPKYRADLQSRRVQWTEVINHAVTTAAFFIGPERTLGSDSAADNAEPVVTKRRTPMLPLPRNLVQRSKVKDRVVGHYRALIEQSPLPPASDLDGLNARLNETFRKAHELALHDVNTAATDGENATLDLRQTVSSTRAAHNAALTTRRRLGHTEENVSRVKATRKAAKASMRRYARAERDEQHNVVSSARIHAPKEMYDRIDELARDRGTPEQRQCQLFLRLNDEQGGLLTTDPARIRRLLLEKRLPVTQLDDVLTDVCEQNVSLALLQNSAINAREVGLDPASAAALSASDAQSPVTKTDLRRKYTRRLEEMVKARARLDGALEHVAQVRALHREHIRELERLFEMGEVISAVSALRQVGSGLDAIQAASLSKFGAAELTGALDLLRGIWNTGRAPTDWGLRRGLLRHKGKGADVYCVENYRGLGIGDTNAKIMALMLTARLRKFLENTNALSHSQGGFLPDRGTHEQVLTLTETVRAATGGDRGRPVYLCFADIRRAYDSIIHPLLWKRCADIGIGGRFLTTLQAMYHEASVVLDIDGELLPPMTIEAGVLQGDPLSPLLFNIYFDVVIRAIEARGAARRKDGAAAPFGIPLPRVHPDANGTTRLRVYPWEATDQLDFLCSLEYADDSTLPSFDIPSLQEMLDTLNDELTACGLSLNVGKTKWMLIPPLRATAAAYEELKRLALLTPLRVENKAVELVDRFDYLGCKIWWRWDWSEAWADARAKAAFRLYEAQCGEFSRHGVAPSILAEYATAKILSQFNTAAAVAGGGGNESSGPWVKNETIVDQVLAAISGMPRAPRRALRAEFGIWDQRRRLDMLMVRLFCKLITCRRDTTHYRAMCLSFETMSSEQRHQPEAVFSRRGLTHRQSWAQVLLSAFCRLNINQWPLPPDQNGIVRHRRPAHYPLYTGLIGVQLCTATAISDTILPLIEANGDRKWIISRNNQVRSARRIDNTTRAHMQAAGATVRLIDARAAPPPDIDAGREGTDFWTLPLGPNDSLTTALAAWSATTEAASFASLRRLANISRQVPARAHLAEARDKNTPEALHAVVKAASYPEPYLDLPANLSLPLLATRINQKNVEERVRAMEIKRSGTGPECRKLPKLDERAQRVCYLCSRPCGSFYSETIDHVLLACSGLADARDEFVRDLRVLIATITAHGHIQNSRPPDLGGPHKLTALLMLAKASTAAGLPPPAPAVAIMTRAQTAAHQAAHGATTAYSHHAVTGTDTAAWFQKAIAAWSSTRRGYYSQSLRGDPRQIDAEAVRLGGQLVTRIARFTIAIHARRRKLLRDRPDFARRERDPNYAAIAAIATAPTPP